MLTLPSMHSAATALARRARVPASIYHSVVSTHVVFEVRLGFFSSAEKSALPHYLLHAPGYNVRGHVCKCAYVPYAYVLHVYRYVMHA